MTVVEKETTRTGEFSEELVSKAGAARMASRPLARVATERKDAALEGIARLLEERAGEVIAANAEDYAAARADGMSDVLLDRLLLNEGARAWHGGGRSRHHRAARSYRRGVRRVHAAKRPPRLPPTRASRRHRRRL